jgi:hypothetical protein
MVVLGLALLVCFAFWENIYKCPLLDPSVWKNRNYTFCVLSVLFGYMSFITNQFWISLYMQEVQKLSPLTIAVRLLPQAVAGILWSYIGQALISRLSGTVIMGIGGIAYLIGATLQIFIRQDTSYWKLLFPSLLITVVGADFQFIVSNVRILLLLSTSLANHSQLYVTQQMPTQSSLAAGVLQTAMRLSVSLGLSITAAIYGSSLSNPHAQKDITYAYDRAYLCSIIFAAIGLLLTPFMRIGIQGAKPAVHKEKENGIFCNAPTEGSSQTHPAGEYRDAASRTPPHDHLSVNGSNTSLAPQSTPATSGGQHAYLPRWSWDSQSAWRDAQLQCFAGGGHVIYEVCIKCLEERRVALGNHGGPSGAGASRKSDDAPVRGGDLGGLKAKPFDVLLLTPTIEASGSGGSGRSSQRDPEWV